MSVPDRLGAGCQADASGYFGAGSGEPYAEALRRGSPLRLVRTAGGAPSSQPWVEPDNESDLGAINVAAFSAAATAWERQLLRDCRGPVLDIGCGPGRMVAAALSLGRRCLGVDVSPQAVAIARGNGLPVLRRSVFTPIPGEGTWQTLLVLDGNIGIGGDPAALIFRAAELLAPGGTLLVEVHPATDRDVAYEAITISESGLRSAPFWWAEVGHRALVRYGAAAGLRPGRVWLGAGRLAVELTAKACAAE